MFDELRVELTFGICFRAASTLILELRGTQAALADYASKHGHEQGPAP